MIRSWGLLLVAGIAPALAAEHGAVDWADVEGRIQYAYYTEDVRALNGVLASLKPKPAEDKEEAAKDDITTQKYFEALAHYRIAQVLVTANKSKAKDAIDDCAEAVDKSVAALPKVLLGLDETDASRHKRAEAYALGTACTLAGREMSTINLPFSGGRMGSHIEEAVKLEPRNPRVKLVEALVAFDRAGKDAAVRNIALQKLRAVTQMFEAARAGASTTPEWGAAEAYAFLGRALLEQHDAVGAREALERSLLVAPDYTFAKRLMAQITR